MEDLMVSTDLLSEQKYAEQNRARIIRRLPPKLVAKEEGLLPIFQKSKRKPLRKLELLFEFMDELHGAIRPYLPCKKGCSLCCHNQAIDVTELEIAFIEQETPHRRQATLGPTPGPRQPCPFLMENVCSIYEARPFLCRRHTVLTQTSHWCHPDRANAEEFPLLGFTEVDRAMGLILSESGNASPTDIRVIFAASGATGN
ncbi:YkgJ family cysteine cluster protein [Thiocapsa rosea]|nr:YkgJ family cysteine cluster protein [Thiocapsa rosea]